MAVSIRLQRRGTTHKPFYHIVAADSRAPRDGRFIEKLGYYDPNHEPSTIEVKAERVQHWFERGAQVSDSTKRLFNLKKIELKRAKTEAAK